jgi:hypothetical protein
MMQEIVLEWQAAAADVLVSMGHNFGKIVLVRVWKP